ncbi:Aspartyl protease family protein [Vitis vinifera]|uniref:Aspartyl protease family protein n=1 Tax=Vitis vinifera TaxID=29760 RepID=A0A438HXZ1_VITVI|nr:Aspartyl protease family protein [Vitis vinifera]
MVDPTPSVPFILLSLLFARSWKWGCLFGREEGPQPAEGSAQAAEHRYQLLLSEIDLGSVFCNARFHALWETMIGFLAFYFGKLTVLGPLNMKISCCVISIYSMPASLFLLYLLKGFQKIEMGATILEMKHRDHCSGVTRDWNEKLQKRLTMDAERVKSLQSRIKRTVPSNTEDVSNAQIPVTSGIELETLNYIVTVELGARKMTVIVDTGSDLTWVQCQPCDSCIINMTPYSNHQHLHPTNQFYAMHRLLGHEKLKFGTILVKDFIFGCGRNNKGLFGGVSGLMGLGRSDLSLISQTSGIFGGVFSYCLPSTERKGSGSLILGGNSSVYRNSSPISYAKMIENPQLYNFYFINLTGISIGGVALQAPSVGPSRILVDSGTVITRLPPTIYKALKAEFLKQFTGFPPAPAFSILDTCFNLSAYQEVDIPTIKLHFEGNAELTVDVTGVFYFVKSDASQVCLALASLEYQDEVAILGNYQQKNLRVIYDTKETKVGFALETCSFE